MPADVNDSSNAFIEAACVPLGSSHSSGTLEQAQAILSAHPELADQSIYTAAILGNQAAVQSFLAHDAGGATAKGGLHGWDALTYLCFSRYLRLDRTRSDGFLRSAKALLDSGASASTGFYSGDHQPTPEFESALYGAAGVAHHAELTRLLLERGADPNDGEVAYHAPEGYDNDALKVLVESGKLTQDSLATMLLRKHDWHDHDGVAWLLEHGADPNRRTPWGGTPFQHALHRDNALVTIELALDRGADALNATGGTSALAIAARRGRKDALESFERRGVPVALQGFDRFLAACARHDGNTARALIAQDQTLASQLIAHGGKPLAEFAGVGNTEGVRLLLDLGVPVTALYKDGDGYFGIAANSMALHVAAWRAHHATVKLLIERGSPVDAQDGRGRTPLMLAVRACVDSYWSHRRSPESVDALLRAGASASRIDLPTGYFEIDRLLSQ